MGQNRLNPSLLRLGKGGTNAPSFPPGSLLFGALGPGNEDAISFNPLTPKDPGDVVRIKSGFPVSFPGDRIIQVVSNTYSTQVALTDSVNWVPTGLSCGITPQFADSQILVMANQTGLGKVGNTNCALVLSLWRNAVNLGSFGYPIAYTSDNTNFFAGTAGQMYLDSPNTLSLVTYSTKGLIIVTAGTMWCQWNSATTSTLVLMEVAA